MRLRMSIAKRIDLDQQEGTLNEDDAFERLRTLCNRVNPFRRPTLRESTCHQDLLLWPQPQSARAGERAQAHVRGSAQERV